jgi:hypothetical protein
MRPPVVAGVGGGVGTTTLALALRGHDGGTAVESAAGSVTADILACRGTVHSLCRAATALEHVGPGPRPVVAVTLDGSRPRGPLHARLQRLERAASAVVLLPHVPRWRTVADPLPEAAGLLVEPGPVPRPLRPYAAAVRELARTVATSGRLHVPAAASLGNDAAGRARAATPAASGPRTDGPERVPRRAESAADPPVLAAFRPAVGALSRGGGRHAAPTPPDDVPLARTPPPGTAAPGVAARPPVPRRRGVRIVGAPAEVRPTRGTASGNDVRDAPVDRAEQAG